MSVSEMGRRSGLPKSTTNRLVGGLEGLGAPEGAATGSARSGELEARSSKATAGPDVLRGEFVRVRESA